MSTHSPSPSSKKRTSKKPTPVQEIQRIPPTLMSGVSYITVIGWGVAYFGLSIKTDNEIFHIRQSFGLHMMMLIIEVLGTFSMFPYFLIHFFWIVYLITMAIMMIQSWRGKQSKIIFLGDKFQEWFSFL